MRTLLRIDASARRDGSHSRRLADYLEAGWRRGHAKTRVVRRDLARTPPPHLSQATIEAFGAAPGDADAAALSDTLIAELQSADDLLISSPLYNFGLPSPLKAYIDHVVRSGHTFRFDGHGSTGLLKGKTAYIITARGGSITPDSDDDFQSEHLRAVLGHIGITAVSTITVDGTAEGPATLADRLARARAQIDDLLRPRELEWAGPFSDDDRIQLAALRTGQAEAIVAGDAKKYARLCVEDIQLMIPGQDIIAGRDHFVACEEKLFSSARFARFEKWPVRIELHGDIAVEVGRQRVVSPARSGQSEVFLPKQKYMHVFRRTDAGWRFAILMSNSCQ